MCTFRTSKMGRVHNRQLTFKGTLREHGPVNTTDNHARAAQLLTPESPPLEPLGWVWAQRTVS